MSVTLKHIAQELGVSQPLVTNALNGKPGVNPETRRRIEETARRLGYDRNSNRAAQMLAAQRHGSRVARGVLAVIFPLVEEAVWQAIPFNRSLVDGLEKEASERGLELTIVPARANEVPRVVRDRQVDGVIFVSSFNALSPEFRELNLPCITVCSANPGTLNLLPDNEGGTYAATKFLIEQGHRRIAYLGMHGRVQSNARYAGYQRALAEHQLLAEGNLTHVVDNVLAMHGRQGMDSLLRTHRVVGGSRPDFTALVCQNDLLAMGAVRRLEEAELRVPRDISVVGFDDVSQQHNFEPALTSVAYDRFAMARRAVELLCQQVERYLKAPEDDTSWRTSGNEVFATQLVIHNSTLPRASTRA